MPAEDEERFQLSNKFWICNKLFDLRDNKEAMHTELTKTFFIISNNLKGYGSYLIMQEIGSSDAKVNVIPNGLEKYMAFTINNNLAFTESMQFMNSSLDTLVKILSHNDFKYLSQEFSGNLLELLREKGVYPYEFMDSFRKFF